MKTFIFSIFVCLLLLLNGCGTTPKSQPIAKEPPKAKKIIQPEELIASALKANSELEQSQLFFQAAEKYWENNLYAQSDAALSSVNIEHLTQEQRQAYIWIMLSLATDSQDQNRLKKLMPLIPQNGYPYLSVDKQVEFAQLMAQAYEILEENIQAAIILIDHRGLIAEDRLSETDEKIWNLLRTTETATLSQYSYTGDNYLVLAWLDLARAIQLNQINLDSQFNALQMWNSLWPDHPASLNPPRELRALQQLPSTRPDSITLALPLSGPLKGAGKAIRDGFMAMYYAQYGSKPDDERLEIGFFDTAENNILELYDEELLSENSLIIGPLDKASLKALNSLDSISTPTLALNYLPEDHKLSNNLFQLGLAPEAEARQLAEHLHKKNFRRIGMILPENNLGFRIFDTIAETFSDLNGEIVESVYYGDQASLSSSVANLLGTAESKSRKRKVQNITQMPLEFLPRRRQDLDALVMIAKPEIARQIKPLFAFHYASDLPVFASSQVHDPSEKSDNHDLDGIEFIEMPWMLNNTIDIKSEIGNSIPDSNKQYTRFYALGADSFSIAPRLHLLQEVRDSQMQGHTGILAMNEDGVITRKMEWAKFKKGKAIIVKE